MMFRKVFIGIVGLALVSSLGAGVANSTEETASGDIVMAGTLNTTEMVGIQPRIATVKCTSTRVFAYGTSNARTVPTTGNGSANCYIEWGMESSAVTVLQAALKGCHDYRGVGSLDGYFGANTADALFKFQSTYAKPADGVYGNKTHNAMKFPSSVTTAGRYLCNRNTPIK